MVVGRWNYQKKDYDPYRIPDSWKISVFCSDMDTKINCAGCGKEMTFAEGYTSREIHGRMGFGYSVCEKCYREEWDRERKYGKDSGT